MQEFELQKGENIIELIKPIPRYMRLHVIGGLFLPSLEGIFTLLVVASVITFLTLPIFYLTSFDNPFGLSFSLSVIISIFLTYKLVNYHSEKVCYWITNKRVVIRKGYLRDYFISIYYKRIHYKRIKAIEIVPTWIEGINEIQIICDAGSPKFFVKTKILKLGE